jgi:hypothetical protein
MSNKPRSIGLKRAIEFLRNRGSRLLLMHTKAPTNKTAELEYYVVPGGYITVIEAQKILERPDVQPYDDGLFPNCTQSWKMGG